MSLLFELLSCPSHIEPPAPTRKRVKRTLENTAAFAPAWRGMLDVKVFFAQCAYIKKYRSCRENSTLLQFLRFFFGKTIYQRSSVIRLEYAKETKRLISTNRLLGYTQQNRKTAYTTLLIAHVCFARSQVSLAYMTQALNTSKKGTLSITYLEVDSYKDTSDALLDNCDRNLECRFSSGIRL